jgi:hypothetical protein
MQSMELHSYFVWGRVSYAATSAGLLTSWGDLFGCGLVKEVWRLVSLCLMWYLWRERNAQHT